MIGLTNTGELSLTVLLTEQGRVVMRKGDRIDIVSDERGQFARVLRIDGPKKIRRRIVRQLRRGERARS